MDRARYLEPSVREDLAEKMLFIAGPRQVGKTTLARRIMASSETSAYLNWDNRGDRAEIRAAHWPGGSALVVLDEIHKWRAWKGWLKGEYDRHRDRLRFLVTGSARLDVYRRGGDSLQGRYHHYRLHPFSLAEAAGRTLASLPEPGSELPVSGRGSRETLDALMRFGGFPEPFLSASTRTLRRWQKERFERFFREDVRDLESVRDLASLQLLADLLPERVASPLSLNALRENLEVSHRALTHWIEIFERLYYIFRIRPYTSLRVRSLQKMPKAYLWDWGVVPSEGARFENLVASHLNKFCNLIEDREGYDVELRYLRDRTGKELDFLVTVGRKPWFAVEAKLSETRVDPALRYFQERLKIPWVYQVVRDARRDFVEAGVRVLPAERFLSALA
ncbi:MAG: ATP-binding protein [Betaproteobacteria bacterium]|nr:ATP-binding protein [Betaproteobacteria bacterium]